MISNQLSNYLHILKLTQDQLSIPPISRYKSAKLLQGLKRDVKDLFSITSMHFINADDEGIDHFHSLLNGLITDVNNAKIKELNIAHGLILFKGHNKLKTSDRSYRTISSCPFIAKALDLYLRDLYSDLWNCLQAETQYQGAGSSHELAVLLVSEAIQFSLHVSTKPVYLLALDA